MTKFENTLQKTFTVKARADKAINSLKGILLGVLADEKIDSYEMKELLMWVKENNSLINRNPFQEFMLIIENTASNGIPTKEAIEDLFWLCQKYEHDSIYYNGITSDLQQLQGILHGLLSNGDLNDDEIFNLHTWLSDNEHLNTYYPYDEIRSLVLTIVSDKKIDEEERIILMAFIKQFVELKNDSIKETVEKLTADVSIAGICAIDPEIVFENKTFCITGILSRGTRNELQTAIRSKGGIPVNTISKKSDYLVIGDTKNACWSYACYGRKVEKALDLRKSGHTIILVHEYDVFDAI